MIMDEAAYFAVCFIIFVLLAYRPAKSKIFGFLDSKIKDIARMLKESEQFKIKAESELKELEASIARADQKHSEMIAKAKEEIESLYEERCKAFHKSIEYRKQAVDANLKQTKIDAISSVEGAFLGLVVNAVENHMKKNASGKTDLKVLKNVA